MNAFEIGLLVQKILTLDRSLTPSSRYQAFAKKNWNRKKQNRKKNSTHGIRGLAKPYSFHYTTRRVVFDYVVFYVIVPRK